MDEAAAGQSAEAATGAADAAAGDSPTPEASASEAPAASEDAPPPEASVDEAPAGPEEAPAAEEAPAPDAAGEAPAGAPPAEAAGEGGTPPPSDYEVIEQGQNPADIAAQEQQAGETLPVNELAQLDQDKTVLFFGTIPLIAITVLALACIAVYFFRRGKNWNDLGEAMRLDPESEGKDAAVSGFSTREMQEMDPTKPSQRLSKVSKLDDKADD